MFLLSRTCINWLKYHCNISLPAACFRFIYLTRHTIRILLGYRTVPGACPQEVHGHAVDYQTLKIEWKPVPSDSHNGQIIYYKVNYTEVDEDGERLEDGVHEEKKVIGAEVLSLVIKGLKAWTRYGVSVSAATSVGEGPASDAIFLMTDESGMFC